MKHFALHIAGITAALFFIITTPSYAQNESKKEAVLQMAKDIKWVSVPDAPAGVMQAALWGDPMTGPYGGFTKFPAGFKSPLHNHTSDSKLVVVKGAYIFDGKKYGPGSYLFIPGGQNHESGGSADSETIFFMEQTGAFDVVPVESSK